MVEKEKDIVERLRLKADIVDGLVKRGTSTQSTTMREAADEIERLRGLVEPDLWDWDIRDKQQKAEIESLRALLQSIQHACHAGINGHNWSITISDADSRKSAD